MGISRQGSEMRFLAAVKKHLSDMTGSGEAAMWIIPSVFIVTDDMEAVMESRAIPPDPWRQQESRSLFSAFSMA